MRRPKHIFQIVVIRRMLIFVFHHKSDGRSGGFPLKNSRKKNNRIRFLSWSCDTRLTRFAPIELVLDKIHIKFETGRTPVEDPANGFAVRFTK